MVVLGLLSESSNSGSSGQDSDTEYFETVKSCKVSSDTVKAKKKSLKSGLYKQAADTEPYVSANLAAFGHSFIMNLCLKMLHLCLWTLKCLWPGKSKLFLAKLGQLPRSWAG